MKQNKKNTFLFILLVLPCLSFFYSRTVQSEETKYLIGMLTLQYDSECTNNQKDIIWKNPHYEIGFAKLKSTKSQDWSGDLGQIVIAEGFVESKYPDSKLKSLSDRITKNGACGFYQQRSDWVMSKSGLRLMREVSARVREIDLFHVSHLVLIKNFVNLSQHENAVVMGIKNVFHKEPKNVKLIAHYEGCYKKPMGIHKEFPVKNWSINETFSVTIPKLIEEENGKNYVLNSLQISSEDDIFLFDLDISMYEKKYEINLPTCSEIKNNHR